jgi:hypothetical protein
MTPKYPIYVPSKGRYDRCLTARFLAQDRTPFKLVVEPQEQYHYSAAFGSDSVLVLPFSNQGVVAARNWIRDHSRAAGHVRHWQLDDNIYGVRRRYRGKRIPCDSGAAMSAAEEFVDRYENVAIAGFNYEMFVPNGFSAPPFYLNVHVYSFTLFLNSLPFGWRGRYNEDTDICLTALSKGWCTVLFNAFLAKKVRTMNLGGGNTDELYRGDGRLVMAKSLERSWPYVVRTDQRFKRAQHIVRGNWKGFDTPLKRRTDIDWSKIVGTTDEFGMQLSKVSEIKSPAVQALLEQFNSQFNSPGQPEQV